MAGKILVAYATRNGSTAEIAAAIGKELLAAGHDVDVTEMKTVTTLDGYNAAGYQAKPREDKPGAHDRRDENGERVPERRATSYF